MGSFYCIFIGFDCLREDNHERIIFQFFFFVCSGDVFLSGDSLPEFRFIYPLASMEFLGGLN